MRQGSVQFGHDGDESFDAAGQPADLESCRRIVQSYGQDLLRTAYLLTDDRQRAWSITRLAFLRLFEALPRLDRDADVRVLLLGHSGQVFLAPPPADASTHAPLSFPLDGARARFQVDDARSRTRAALTLLDPTARLTLLLRDLHGVEVEQISALVQQRPDVLTAGLEASRQRVRSYVDLPPHEHLLRTLTSAGFDAPSVDLWPALADDVAELLRRAGSKARMLTAGVLVVVAAVFVVVLVALFGNAPDTRVIAEPVSDGVGDPAPFPTIVFPASIGTSPARSTQPSATVATEVVPATLFMALEDERVSNGLTNLTEFHPGQPIGIPSITDGPRPAREDWPPLLAPDGRQMFITRYEAGNSETRIVVSAIDSTTLAVNWQAELTQLPGALSIDRKPDVLVRLAVDDERVYATLHAWQSRALIQVVVLDSNDGRVVNQWPVNMAGLAANDVRLILPPGGDRLYVFAIVQDVSAIGGLMQLGFYGYQLPDGEQVHAKSLIESDANRVFYLYQGNVAADGRSMYGLTYAGRTHSLAVQFFDLFTATVQRPEKIPFRVEGGELPFQTATSHDGRWLYVFSPLSFEMAIVDLESRNLLGIIPLDVQLEHRTSLSGAYLADNTMQVSPDGTRIYAIGATTEEGTQTSGVLVIDTSTWTVTDHWLRQSTPGRLLLSGDGRTLYLHEQGVSIKGGIAGRLWIVNTATGTQIAHDSPMVLPDSISVELQSLVGIYRQQYGFSPNLADVRPVDNRAFTSLPSVEATIEPLSISPGQRITIDVRFVDPLSKEPLVEGQSDPRFRPESGVRAVLSNTSGEAEDIILALGHAGYSEFRGTVVVSAPGEWILSIVNDWSGVQSAGQLMTTNTRVEVLAHPIGFRTGSFNVVPEGDPGYYSPSLP